MRILVTGSAGHLGEAIVRMIDGTDHEAIGLDLKSSRTTHAVGSILDRELVGRLASQVDAIIHTASLHKPHVATHSRQDFVDVNITGTLNLLEAAVSAGLQRFVFTSTTSAFGSALQRKDEEDAAWITETVHAPAKNIYGATKTAAEELCQLFHRMHSLCCIVLRTSRFFPEDDDSPQIRDRFVLQNAKANEFLFRRVDLEDAARAHLCALEKVTSIGFDRFIISATSPFEPEELGRLRRNAPAQVRGHYPDFDRIYERLGWRMFESIDRVYVNSRARRKLGWFPVYDFRHILDQADSGQTIGSAMAQQVGTKGYHETAFSDGPYPTA